MKGKKTSTTRLDVQIPSELYERLVYMAELPAHAAHGGTLEALVVRALDDGSIGIGLHYERFEDKKLVTDEVNRLAFGHRSKSPTRMAAGSKGRRLIHRR